MTSTDKYIHIYCQSFAFSAGAACSRNSNFQ